MKRLVSLWQLELAAAVALLGYPLSPRSAPADLNLQAQLVWGTNNEKPDDPKLKDVDPQVKDKLRGVFKWKNYFEVKREIVGSREGERRKARAANQVPQASSLRNRCGIEFPVGPTNSVFLQKIPQIKVVFASPVF